MNGEEKQLIENVNTQLALLNQALRYTNDTIERIEKTVDVNRQQIEKNYHVMVECTGEHETLLAVHNEKFEQNDQAWGRLWKTISGMILTIFGLIASFIATKIVG